MAGLLTLAALAIAAPSFGFTPPPGFHPDSELTPADADGFGPTLEGDGERHLVAYLVDGEGPRAASLSVSVVDGALEIEPSQRPLLASATAAYFRSGLDLPFDLDRAVAVGQRRPRIEVWGKTTVGDQSRRVLVAYFAGHRRHGVVVASIPESRADAITPQLGSALDTFVEDDSLEPWARHRMAISVAVWGLAGLVLAGVGVTRRHRDHQDRDSG